MKKNFIILVFCFVAVFGLYAREYKDILEEGPSSGGPNCYKQDGYALVAGKKTHYWLYKIYSDYDYKVSYLLGKVFPEWVENLGYVIDFDNIRKVSPNTSLASSVKALMKQRGCDVSVTLWQEKSGDTLIVNIYDSEDNTYWSIFYPLVK